MGKIKFIWSGDKVGFRSHHGKYVVAEADGRLNANRGHMLSWEQFDVVECPLPGCIGLKSHHGKYVVAEANGAMNANRGHFLTWERFTPKYHGEKVTLLKRTVT